MLRWDRYAWWPTEQKMVARGRGKGVTDYWGEFSYRNVYPSKTDGEDKAWILTWGQLDWDPQEWSRSTRLCWVQDRRTNTPCRTYWTTKASISNAMITSHAITVYYISGHNNLHLKSETFSSDDRHEVMISGIKSIMFMSLYYRVPRTYCTINRYT